MAAHSKYDCGPTLAFRDHLKKKTNQKNKPCPSPAIKYELASLKASVTLTDALEETQNRGRGVPSLLFQIRAKKNRFFTP